VVVGRDEYGDNGSEGRDNVKKQRERARTGEGKKCIKAKSTN